MGGDGDTEEDTAARAALAEEERRNKVVTKLHSILRPFLLRRIKDQVEKSLPKKKEILLWAGMSEHQEQFNRALVDKTISDLLEKMSGGSVSGQGRVQMASTMGNVLMQLRKNCNHPDLITGGCDGSVFFPSKEELIKQCGKFELLDRLLRRLRENGHKVLIFSQMTKMLDLLKHYLSELGFQPCRIDGSVHIDDRRRQMKAFNEDPEYFVFLLSTRAGGLGINLTGADTCIIYDSDWNPHQDLQAMDRCHRIGQTKPVHVYRLATANSVEGKMLKRANSKLMLEKLVITSGGFSAPSTNKKDGPQNFSTEGLIDLLKGQADEDDQEPQSGVISDADLVKVMDRSDLDDPEKQSFAMLGRGWEVVEQQSAGLLTTVD